MKDFKQQATIWVGLSTMLAFALLPTPSHAQSESKRIHLKYKPTVGESHPDFILPTIDGKKQIQLSSYRGKKVLLLHFASW